jgi:hypothetical protein
MYLAAFCGASVTVRHDLIVSTQSHKNEGLDVVVRLLLLDISFTPYPLDLEHTRFTEAHPMVEPGLP